MKIKLLLCLVSFFLLIQEATVYAGSQDDEVTVTHKVKKKKKKKTEKEPIEAEAAAPATAESKGAVIEFLKSEEDKEKAKETVRCCGAFGVSIFKGIRKKQEEKKGEKLEAMDIVIVVAESLVSTLEERKILDAPNVEPLMPKRKAATMSLKDELAALPGKEPRKSCCFPRREKTPPALNTDFIVKLVKSHFFTQVENHMLGEAQEIGEDVFNKLTEEAINAAIEELSVREMTEEVKALTKYKEVMIKKARESLTFVHEETEEDEVRTAKFVEVPLTAGGAAVAVDADDVDDGPWALTPRNEKRTVRVRKKVRVRKVGEGE